MSPYTTNVESLVQACYRWTYDLSGKNCRDLTEVNDTEQENLVSPNKWMIF